MIKKLQFILLVLAFSDAYVQAQFSITGTITYDNSINTVIEFSRLNLMDSINKVVSKTYTDSFGHYTFTNIPNGKYSIEIIPNYAWGGGNTLDALLINRYFIKAYAFKDALKKKAADVNKDGNIDPFDALLVNRRYIKAIYSFKAVDWQTINNVVVQGRNANENIKVICTGDVDGSYIPIYNFSCGDSLVDFINGQAFKSVQIGTQCWMQQNLANTKYNDGTAIPNVTVNTLWKNLTTPAYCWYKDSIIPYKNTYGALYNWYAVHTGKLCPAGWHVPDSSEWSKLIVYVGGYNVAGGAMKEAGTAHWISPNLGATNSSGFTALPGGYRAVYDGSFVNLGFSTYWWAATYYYGAGGWSCWVDCSTQSTGLQSNFDQYGFSVRCLKNN